MIAINFITFQIKNFNKMCTYGLKVVLVHVHIPYHSGQEVKFEKKKILSVTVSRD